MAIIKSRHASNFTTLPNEVFKQGLSMEALGLLAYLISLPHDWVVYKTTLHKTFEVGEKKLDRPFKELQEKGYILSVKKHVDGKFQYEHIVYDKPFNGENSTPPFQGGRNEGVELVGVQREGVEKAGLQKKHITNETTTKEIVTKIKIGAAPYFDIIAAINSNIDIYQAVLNTKKEGTDPDAFLDYLKKEFPVYVFTDINHFINAIKAKLKAFEAKNKSGIQKPNNPMDGMVL
jgi:predicted MPP superfamily phosphohydrolase